MFFQGFKDTDQNSFFEKGDTRRKITTLIILSFLCAQLIFKANSIGDEELGEWVEYLSITNTQFPIEVNKQIEPGYFYRKLDSSDLEGNVDGVYAQDAKYYEEDLFQNKRSVKEFVFSSPTTTYKNWMRAVFFGVWSHGAKFDDTTLVSVPIRFGDMTYVNGDGKRMYNLPMIWRSGHGNSTTVDCDGKRFKIIPSAGKHTEGKFLEHIKTKEVQEKLWKYFISETAKNRVPAIRKLDLIGFTLYSTNDACDS